MHRVEATSTRSDLIGKLAELSDDEGLARIVVTAALESGGGLAKIGDATTKFVAAIKNHSLPVMPKIFAVASKQEDILKLEGIQAHLSGTDQPRLIGPATFADLVTRLYCLPRGRVGVERIDFNELRPAEEFCCRDWLIDEIANRLRKHDRGYLLLKTPWGFGKSTTLRRLVASHISCSFGTGDWLGAWHFIRWNDNLQPIETLVGQIEWWLRDRLLCPLSATEAKVKIPKDISRAASVLHIAIRKAAAKFRETEEYTSASTGKKPKLLIVIDGLDEAFDANAGMKTLKQLRTLFPVPEEGKLVLPEGVFVLFSTRPGRYLNHWLIQPDYFAEVIDIDPNKSPLLWEKNLSDIRSFLNQRIGTLDINLTGCKQAPPEAANALIKRMAEACEGTFLNATWYANTAKEDPKAFHGWLNNPDSLPHGSKRMLADWARKTRNLDDNPQLRCVMLFIAIAIALWHEAKTRVTQELIYELIERAGLAPDAPRVGVFSAKILSDRNIEDALDRLRDWFNGGAEETPRFYCFRHIATCKEFLLDTALNLPESNKGRLLIDVHQLLGWSCLHWQKKNGEVRSAMHANLAWHVAHFDLSCAIKLLAEPSYLMATRDETTRRMLNMASLAALKKARKQGEAVVEQVLLNSPHFGVYLQEQIKEENVA